MNNEELDLVVKRIMKLYKIGDQQDIPLSVKRNKGYVSQIKSRNHIPEDFIELLKLKYPKAFESNDETTNTIPQFLNMLDRQLKLLEDQHKTIHSQAEHIRFLAERAPDISETRKNASPSSKIKIVNPVK